MIVTIRTLILLIVRFIQQSQLDDDSTDGILSTEDVNVIVYFIWKKIK